MVIFKLLTQDSHLVKLIPDNLIIIVQSNFTLLNFHYCNHTNSVPFCSIKSQILFDSITRSSSSTLGLTVLILLLARFRTLAKIAIKHPFRQIQSDQWLHIEYHWRSCFLEKKKYTILTQYIMKSEMRSLEKTNEETSW